MKSKYCLYNVTTKKMYANNRTMVEPFERKEFNTMRWNSKIEWYDDFNKALDAKIKVLNFEPTFEVVTMEFLD